uniref:Uncharacterized protein n=1 Tax=Romanomermis culicivorax TaxID=13658 RepID=A0A915HZM3_ROMCU
MPKIKVQPKPLILAKRTIRHPTKAKTEFDRTHLLARLKAEKQACPPRNVQRNVATLGVVFCVRFETPVDVIVIGQHDYSLQTARSKNGFNKALTIVPPKVLAIDDHPPQKVRLTPQDHGPPLHIELLSLFCAIQFFRIMECARCETES